MLKLECEYRRLFDFIVYGYCVGSLVYFNIDSVIRIEVMYFLVVEWYVEW